MYYLVINEELVFESNNLLDCTEWAERYVLPFEEKLITYEGDEIDNPNSVVVYDEGKAILRKAREHEYDDSGWVWKPTLSLVK